MGIKIRKIRNKLGISQEELAFRINSSRNYIGCIERAEKFPSINTILDIAQALNIEIYKLFKSAD